MDVFYIYLQEEINAILSGKKIKNFTGWEWISKNMLWIYATIKIDKIFLQYVGGIRKALSAQVKITMS